MMRKVVCSSVGLMVALTALSGWAQVEVVLTIENTAILVHEPLLARVTIQNHGAGPVTLNDGRANAPALRFRVERENDEGVSMASDAPALPRTVVPAGACADCLVDLTDHFPMDRPGRYFVRVHVEGGGLSAVSRLALVDVVPGLELTQSKVRVPGAVGVERHYSLRHWARGGTDYLFLCVSESPAGRTYRPVNLGPVLRVIKPTITVDGAATATITHQINRGQLMVSTVQSQGKGLSLISQKAIRILSGPQMEPAATVPVK